MGIPFQSRLRTAQVVIVIIGIAEIKGPKWRGVPLYLGGELVLRTPYCLRCRGHKLWGQPGRSRDTVGLSSGCRSGRNGVNFLINAMGPCVIAGALVPQPPTWEVLMSHDDVLRKGRSKAK